MNTIDCIFVATDITVAINAAHCRGDFAEASHLAGLGMDAADRVLCDIEDGFADLHSHRVAEFTALWDALWTLQINADTAARAAA
jgi:hypothetical protein